MQALYAFFQSENDRVDIAERAIIERIDKIKGLFIYQISFLLEIIKFARENTEDAKHKYVPKEEDLNPNTRFMDSLIVKQLEENQQYKDGLNAFKINWADEKELIRSIYQKIKKSKDYELYLQSEKGYDADRDFIVKIFKKYLVNNSVLRAYYEEKSIFWADDYNFVNIEIQKTLKCFRENEENYLYKDKDNFSEDIDFILHLFRKTIIYSAEYEKIISEIIKNWEAERIAAIDMLLMKMAICELLNFPEIPVKVSLNEYIEIAKIYSTPKSSNFINGILDKLLDDFKRNDKINKTGRGIIE